MKKKLTQISIIAYRSASAFAPLVTTSSAWHQALVPVHTSTHQTWHNPSATTATAV